MHRYLVTYGVSLADVSGGRYASRELDRGTTKLKLAKRRGLEDKEDRTGHL